MKVNFKTTPKKVSFEDEPKKQGRPPKQDKAIAKKIYFNKTELKELKTLQEASGLGFSPFIKTLIKKGLEC